MGHNLTDTVHEKAGAVVVPSCMRAASRSYFQTLKFVSQLSQKFLISSFLIKKMRKYIVFSW